MHSAEASITCFLMRDQQLLERNTFRVPARAARYTEVRDVRAMPELLERPQVRGMPLLALGDGSNLLLTHDFEGLVLHIANTGILVHGSDGASTQLRVAAGERWDNFVRWSLAQGYAGLENLILIPGTVGAAPIQNIGAYGSEVSEFITTVEAWDRSKGEFVQLDKATCAFAYRDSLFKHEPERFIITAVDFELPHRHELKLDYSGLRQELEAMGVDAPQPADVALAVETLRRRKLPDPALIGNAGSFFVSCSLLPTKRVHVHVGQVEVARTIHRQFSLKSSLHRRLGQGLYQDAFLDNEPARLRVPARTRRPNPRGCAIVGPTRFASLRSTSVVPPSGSSQLKSL